VIGRGWVAFTLAVLIDRALMAIVCALAAARSVMDLMIQDPMKQRHR
jgi:hypothetical protein